MTSKQGAFINDEGEKRQNRGMDWEAIGGYNSFRMKMEPHFDGV